MQFLQHKKTMSEIIKQIQHVVDGGNLALEDSSRIFQIIMNGGATPAQVAALLVALRLKGETVDEIAGAALTMRSKCFKISSQPGTIDTCGTGGDNKGTLNISTAVAFVLAGCGIPVAKHGNRAITSKSGSADVLKELGVNLEADVGVVQQCLDEVGICFMLAPVFHRAMKYVAPVRTEIGIRTIFNILGPLTNPADAEFQLLGVYEKSKVRPVAETLKKIGIKRAWVVCGSDGMDELTLGGSTHVAELQNGFIRFFDVLPSDAGLPKYSLKDISGGTSMYNAREMRTTLLGAKGPYRDTVLLNAAAGLIVAGKAESLKAGVSMAAEAIDEGKANEKLVELIRVSGGK